MSCAASVAGGLTAVPIVHLVCMDIKFKLYLVLDLNRPSANGDGLYAKVGLVQLGLALIAVRTSADFKAQLLVHSVQAQHARNTIVSGAGLLHPRGLETYLR